MQDGLTVLKPSCVSTYSKLICTPSPNLMTTFGSHPWVVALESFYCNKIKQYKVMITYYMHGFHMKLVKSVSLLV